MKISGSNQLTSSVDQVWGAMLDPAVLARCLPGCESLTTTGPDQYAMRVTMGVAAIKGTYDGEVAITDKNEPDSLRLKATGSGAPGTIDASVDVRLQPSTLGGTELFYDADATVGGTIGGVGQRMLAGVTRKTAAQFFTALDADIAGGGALAVPAAPGVPAAPAAPGAPAAADGAAPAIGQVFSGRPAAAKPAVGLEGATGFALGAVLGGALVAIGVLIGSRISRRR